MTEDETVGWHHGLNGCESEQTPGEVTGKGQGSLACCTPWGGKELDTIERLNDSFALLLPAGWKPHHKKLSTHGGSLVCSKMHRC